MVFVFADRSAAASIDVGVAMIGCTLADISAANTL